MEYRHKIMRGTVGVIINKAIRDIRSDPKRSIRNLADLGDNFSTSAAQKRFFSLAREILKNPDNPYNELIVNMIENVNTEAVYTMSLNFGYTSLNYGADILREQEATLDRYIPWLLIFDFSAENGKIPDFEQISSLISNAISLGIYTLIFEIHHSLEGLTQVLELCKKYKECSFFAAVSPEILLGPKEEKIVRTPNLVVSVDVTDPAAEKTADTALHLLQGAKCFYGFHAYYNEENVKWLMSDQFKQQMIQNGCLIGSYVNTDRNEEELEDRMYRFVCTSRGKKGQPLFAMDFYRDISYIGNTISCGDYLHLDGNGNIIGLATGLDQVVLGNLMKR